VRVALISIITILIVLLASSRTTHVSGSPLTVVPITYTERILVPIQITTTIYPPPEIIEVERVVNHTKYLTRIVTRTQDVPRPYQNWESVDQFKEWYEDQQFTVIFPNGGDRKTADCDEYAYRLQKVALRAGYPVSIALVTRDGMFFDKVVRGGTKAHAGNLVEINDVYYYVEPLVKGMYMVRIARRD